MALLDKLPDSTWFFCFPMSFAVMVVTFLGILHPLFWMPVWRVYRSELFVFMYILVGFWSLLSCALLYGIIAESSCLYVFWIYYTVVFSLVMSGMMFLLFCGFCVLGMKRKSIFALLGLLYYLVTIYFATIVNMQRKEIFGLASYCGSCPERRHNIEPKIDRGIRTLIPMTIETTTSEIVTPAMVTTKPTSITTTLTNPMTNGIVIMVMTSKMETTVAPTVPTAVMKSTASTTAIPHLRAYVQESVSPESYFMPTHEWSKVPLRRDLPQDPDEVSTSTLAELPSNPDRGLSAIARLANILINSDECRKPLKPSHGRYLVTEDRDTLHLTLRCDNGYKETSESTECRRNWWNKPIPQCRRRKSPQQSTGCQLPGYPEHGEYTVVDNPHARPGDDVGDSVILAVTCDPPYKPVDAYVICNEGRWRHAPPNCQRHCRLTPNPTVEYKCLNGFKDDFVPCGVWQPAGALVVPTCARGHAHRGPFRYMRCKGSIWTHVLECTNNFTWF